MSEIHGRVVEPVDGADPEIRRRLAELERVHPIRSDADLDRRLATEDRLIFGLFDGGRSADRMAAMVEVALSDHWVSSMTEILDSEAATVRSPSAAIFYSINADPELAGKRVAPDLIKGAVSHLSRIRPTITTFATLSPIPSLRDHVTADDPELARSADAAVTTADKTGDSPPVDEALLRAAARHLIVPIGGRLADPVGNFHVRNGAQVARLWWWSDRSELGRSRSWGLMTSYRYDPDRLAERAAAYASEGAVSVSDEVASLLG